GCPPLPRVNRFTPGFRCAKFIDAVRMQLENDETISTVVFGSVWADYFLGAYNIQNGRTDLYIIDKSGGRAPVNIGSNTFNDVFSEFGAFVGQLVQSGKRVIIITPVPTRYENIPKEMYIAEWQNRTVPDLSISEDEFRQYSEPVVSALRASVSTSNVEIIDPMNFLCKEGRCPVLAADGRPLYKDGGHLRPFAVREKAAFLDKIVR
ncbi:SGNH hydrolase domain-containing protein, partial [Rhodoblastus sp.]|uniref:SGNH hydrolase domain-containing protein n=1 Tax=Rhodoblastus sp. TaxID=1962975 RepID=UPI003F980CE3